MLSTSSECLMYVQFTSCVYRVYSLYEVAIEWIQKKDLLER